MTQHVAVTAIGPDRPGIVASITKSLYELGCNLEDATSTVLRGHFAIVMIATVPDGMSSTDVESRVAADSEDLGVIVTARAVEEIESHRSPATHLVSVYGADKPGIVFEVARLLADRQINILDLNSRTLDSDEGASYVVMLEVSGPGAAEVEPALVELTDQLGVDVSIHPIETDIF